MDNFNKKLFLKEIKRNHIEDNTPNYQLMGYEPPVAGQNLIPNELKRKVKPHNLSPTIVEEKSIKVQAKNPRSQKIPQQSQTVMSGMNDEQTWMNDKTFSRVSYPEDQNYIDVDKLQGQDNLNVQETDYEQYDTEDAVIPQALSSLPLMQRGEFAVFIDGEFFKKSFDLAAIKSFVEDVLINYKIDMDRISVVKSLNIDFGLILNDV